MPQTWSSHSLALPLGIHSCCLLIDDYSSWWWGTEAFMQGLNSVLGRPCFLVPQKNGFVFWNIQLVTNMLCIDAYIYCEVYSNMWGRVMLNRIVVYLFRERRESLSKRHRNINNMYNILLPKLVSYCKNIIILLYFYVYFMWTLCTLNLYLIR